MLIWTCTPFDSLSPHALYAVLHLRTEVFVMEQQCPFQDLDYSDDRALHLQGLSDKGELLAYSRLFAKGIKYAEASIGRVMTRLDQRRTGLGKVLMHESIARCEALWPGEPVRIGAQARLQRFYDGFGFVVASAVYLEDGIDHIEMLRAG